MAYSTKRLTRTSYKIMVKSIPFTITYIISRLLLIKILVVFHTSYHNHIFCPYKPK